MTSFEAGFRSDLDRLFRPHSVALIGASEKSFWSMSIAQRFKAYGFPGKVFAVNRGGVAAHGYPGFTSCTLIPEAVDSAYILVPADSVLQALDDAADAGIRSVVLLTSGFAESDAAGVELQDRLVALARKRGIVLMGPNSMGFVNVAERRPVTVVPVRLPVIDGGVAVVSQSGAVAAEITKFAHQQGVGLSFIAATGNEAMVGIGDIVDHLVDDAPTRVIAVFSESIRDPERLKSAARRARAAQKAIVILKVGKSETTAAVAQAHTGSLVGDDAVFDAVCRQFGIIRVVSIEELILTAALIDRIGPLPRPGVGVVSISGGACGMFADLAEAQGVSLPAFSGATVTALQEVLPSFGASLNPLDITGAAVRDPALWQRVLAIVGRDPSIGVLLAINSIAAIPAEIPGFVQLGRHLAAGFEGLGDVKGILLAQTVQPHTEATSDFLSETGNPLTGYSIEYTARALGHLTRWTASLAQPFVDAPAVTKTAERPIGERDVLAFLARQGVPVIPAQLAATAEKAAMHARLLDGPVALKIASPDIAHKTEVGGVRLNVSGPEAVARAFGEIVASVRAAAADARIDGVIVAPMRTAGTELFVGTARDPVWGPVIAVGIGGIWVEALNDTALRLLPVTRGDVREMLGSLRGAKLLQGFRGSTPVDLDAVADAAVRIGEAALALGPTLVSLEVNPLLADGSRVEALDGLIVWAA